MTKKLDDWLTVADAAVELGVSPQRIRALIYAGRLQARILNPGKHVSHYLIARANLAAVRVRKPGRPFTATWLCTSDAGCTIDGQPAQ